MEAIYVAFRDVEKAGAMSLGSLTKRSEGEMNTCPNTPILLLG
jgi:hypothetical protein